MKKLTYIFILLFLFSCGDKKPYPIKIDDFRPELRIYLYKLLGDKYLYTTDPVASSFLNKNCTKEELLQLLECEDPLLRVIAFRTLGNRKDKDYFKILLGHLNDTAKISWYEGD